MTRAAPPTPSRRSLGVLFAVVIVDLVGFGVVIPILPYYAESYGASATVLGVLLTCYSAMQFVFAPIWGRLSDRIGRRPVLLFTIAGTALSLFVLGLADSLFGLFVARILGGMFGANISVATAYVADSTPDDQRTRYMGLIGASFGIGFILGPAIGGLLAPLGYSVPMFFAAALGACNLVLAALLLPEPARHVARRPGALPRKRFFSLPPLVRRLCLTYLLFSLAVSQLETVFAFFMMDRFGYDARAVAFLLVAMALVMASIQGGAIRPLANRLGERTLVSAGAVLMAISFAAAPTQPTVALLLIPLIALAAGRAVSQPSLLGYVSTAASEEERGAAMGYFQSSASLARVTGPLIAGPLYDRWFAAPFLLAAGLMLLVLALGVTLPARARESIDVAPPSGGEAVP